MSEKHLAKIKRLGYDYWIMNVFLSSNRKTSLLGASLLIAGVFAAIGLAWALFHRPELADQIIALSGILFTISLIFYDPLTAFLVWLFVIPFVPFLHLDLRMPAGIPDLSYTRVVGSFFAIYIFAQITRGKRKFLTPTFFDLSLPFFILPLVASAVRGYYGWFWGLQSVFDSFLIPILIYFIARQTILTPDDFRALAKTLISITVIIAVAAIIEQTTGFAPFRTTSTGAIYSGDLRKVGSFLGNPAYVALALAVVIPLAMMLSIEKPHFRERFSYLLAFLALESGIVATFNRSGIFGGVIGPLAFSFLNRRLLKFVLPALLIIGLLVGLGWGLIEDTSVAGRLSSESPIDYRLKALEIGLDIHKSAPFFGVGWGWFGRMAANRGFRDNGVNVLPSTHNSYLNFLVSGGYALLGGYLLMAGSLLLTLIMIGWPRRRKRRFFPLFIQAAIASYFAYFIPIAAFDNTFSGYANILFLAIIGGAISATFGCGSFTDSADAPAIIRQGE